MHSVDYAVERRLSVRPSDLLSVRLSVCHTPVFCLKSETAIRILKVFLPSGSPTILVFHFKRDGNIPTGAPGQMQGGLKKITIFDQYLSLSRK